jgi:thiol:disulfide interchange protein
MPSDRTHSRKPSNSPVLVALASAAALFAVLTAPSSSFAEAPAPAKADSSARRRPLDAVLSASVSPIEARPGEKVVFKVTAKLKPGWHIYTYAKEQQGDGPRNTSFDFFDTDGLTVAGDWTASKPAIRKKEPAFPNVEFVSFYEDEVTWSLPLTVPAGATPGKKTLKCQAFYQICDAKSCSFPGRWTLPEVVLTVLPAGGAAAPPAAAKDAIAAREPAAPAAAPARPVPAAAPEQREPAPQVVSEVERSAQQGIIPLMIASALGGLLALVMPCVWPMVPITVNFFVKQGQRKEGRPTALAITYCLAIIGVFTAVGVLCSFFLSATALPRLANNPWLNFGVAGLFFAFGLSLLGLFEIRLPNALLNASAKGEGRGGLVGVVFMALTLTITSFTCTFPVVGGLLVMASAGQFFYPIIGLATFATVLALPFFLLALSPGLLSRMPKSGDWMNAVKVVGGLVEIGAAFKFLNTAELAYVTPENAWINAPFILTAWVVLAAVCGFYLLGFFRTDHDHEEVKIGPGRMILGTSFLGMALFLAPALFGRPPQSQIWNRLVVGLLPPDVSRLSSGGGSGGGGAVVQEEVHATSADPKKAEREERRFHGVWWGFSYEQALEKAKAENKPILIDFTGVNCANCRLMEAGVFPKPEVVKALRDFITIQLYTPPNVPINSIKLEEREKLAEQNADREMDWTKQTTNPLYVVVSPAGEVLSTATTSEPAEFVGFLNKALSKAKGGPAGKVASAEAESESAGSLGR